MIKDFACGLLFSILLDSQGRLYVSGQIDGMLSPKFQLWTVPFPRKCLKVASGRKHFMVLLESGLVLSCGVGFFGQLGTATTTTRLSCACPGPRAQKDRLDGHRHRVWRQS